MTTLAELRQASLKEQKQKEQSSRPPEATGAGAPDEAVPAAPMVQRDAPTPVSGVVSTNGNGHHAPLREVVAQAPEPVPPAASPEAVKAEKFFTRLHETLARKTLHTSGAKVSADMPPALFHRAKRYCLDHGNITLRQILIELLTAYLEEEGY